MYIGRLQCPVMPVVSLHVYSKQKSWSAHSRGCKTVYIWYIVVQHEHTVVVQAVGMAHMDLGRDPSTLSDGYKRRLALAVQLLRKPDLLLLDEPLAGAGPVRLFWTCGTCGHLALSSKRAAS